MKIAYCIICHKYTPVLETLVDLLSDGNDIYLHVDRKTDIGLFAPLRGRVTFVEPRVDVRWGTFSQIECMLRLFEAAIGYEYDYLSLLSGDTLPLRSNDEIKRFLEAQRGNQLILVEETLPGHYLRLKYKYPSDDIRRRSLGVRLIREVQRRFRLYLRNPYYETLPPLAFGSNWITITPDFRDYVFDYLKRNPSYVKAFRYAFCGDELFFHTILQQSPFRDGNSNVCFFYVDWKTGPQMPRTLDETDFLRMAAARQRQTVREFYLFARKISDRIDLRKYVDTFIPYSGEAKIP